MGYQYNNDEKFIWNFWVGMQHLDVSSRSLKTLEHSSSFAESKFI